MNAKIFLPLIMTIVCGFTSNAFANNTSTNSTKNKETLDLVQKYATFYNIQETVNFEFKDFSKDAHSSGHAEMEWGPDICKIRIDPLKAEQFWGADNNFEHALAFVSLHELAHCIYYKDQHLDWKNAGYKGTVLPHVLDEYLISDAVVELQDRAGFLALAHEAYADAFAIQAFRKLGFSWKALENIKVLREKSVFDKVHATAEVFNMLRNGNYEHLDPGATAKIIAAKFMIQEENFKFVIRDMNDKNSFSYIVNNWCSLVMTEERYPIEHPMLGKVGMTANFYPSFRMPQFIKTRFDENSIDWKERCKKESFAFLELSSN